MNTNKLTKVSEGFYSGIYKNISFTLQRFGLSNEWTFTYSTSVGISEAEDVFPTRKAAHQACLSWIQYKRTVSPKLFI